MSGMHTRRFPDADRMREHDRECRDASDHAGEVVECERCHVEFKLAGDGQGSCPLCFTTYGYDIGGKLIQTKRGLAEDEIER